MKSFKNKYFGKKGMKMIYKVHWIVDGVAEIDGIQRRCREEIARKS